MPGYNIVNVIPHDAPMSLLDRITSYWDDGLQAEVTIRPESLFCEERGVPAWVGIEYMGQAIAAYGGICARQAGEPVKIGFLASVRRYESQQAYFAIGSVLAVRVEQLTDNLSGLRVFNCRITANGINIQANLNVFMPDNAEDFLMGQAE